MAEIRIMQKLLCLILGHRYCIYAKPIEGWATGIRWLKCRRCNGNFVINDRVKYFGPMDFEMKDMHKWRRAK